jgi:hypothetical protein
MSDFTIKLEKPMTLNLKLNELEDKPEEKPKEDKPEENK